MILFFTLYLKDFFSVAHAAHAARFKSINTRIFQTECLPMISDSY